MHSDITAQQAAGLLDGIVAIAARASSAILAIPLAQAGARAKEDMSPVTAADEASDRLILKGLADLLPGVPVISEESAAQSPMQVAGTCIIVDPLDGTKEFLAGRDEYTVNIAIVTKGVPIAGVITAPAQGVVWRGATGHGAERLRMQWDTLAISDRGPIHVRRAPDRLVVATSRTHLDANTEAYLSHLAIDRRYPCGSSVKFCHVAQGEADIYPRLSPTCEWDIAAGCAILAAAGGVATNPDGGPLRFGGVSPKFLVPGFIAWGDPAPRAR